MRFEKGSPEAKAYMAKIRGGGSGRYVGVREPREPRTKILAAHSEGEGFVASAIRDAHGNVAGSFSMPKVAPVEAPRGEREVLELELLKMELSAEKKRVREEKEQKALLKNIAIGAGVLVVAWFMFKAPTPANPSTPKA